MMRLECEDCFVFDCEHYCSSTRMCAGGESEVEETMSEAIVSFCN